jgi:hypothetical protein
MTKNQNIMKKILIIFTLLVLASCGNTAVKKNHSLIGMEFQEFRQINQLKNYIKVSDTAIYENNMEPKYGILHLQNESTNLVVFKSSTLDSIQNLTFKILDTLAIPISKNSEFITIGYCAINNRNDENIIAIVEKTDRLKIQNIKKVWSANTVSRKIEIITNLNEISCNNEFFIQK